MTIFIRFLVLTFFITVVISCEHTTVYEDSLEGIIRNSEDSLFQSVIKNKDKYELQIIYSPVSTDSLGHLRIDHYSFNRNDSLYFYPASTVKMPTAFLAIEYLNELNKRYDLDLNRHSRMAFDSAAPPQRPEVIDTCSAKGYPTIEHYIEKVFAISDNNAYNRLYELMGQDYINDKLREKGIFRNSRIRTRVGEGGFDTESNKYTNPYRFLDQQGSVIYQQEEQYALYSAFPALEGTQKGLGYYDDDLDTTIYSPFDMSEKNFINLFDLQQSLERIIYPELFDSIQQYQLTEEQYSFIRSSMRKLPRDFSYLKDHEEYYDSYVKFFMFGDSKEPMPDHIKISNKVGWAYGYLTDCAYIEDVKNDIHFFLSATIHVNENGIYNDGVYEYEQIGVPFLAQLGREVYQYELQKSKD